LKTRDILCTSGLVLMLGQAAGAEDLVFTHPSGATATFYGQLTLNYQRVDDGRKTYDEVVDNSNSTSKVGLWIDVPQEWGSFRFNLETNLGFKNTADVSQIDDEDWIDWQRTDIRKLEGVFSGRFGTLWMGQGSMATDGTSEFDNSGTGIVGYSYIPDTAGAYFFRDGDTLSGITIADAFDDFNGPRRFRIRYDTPEFSGLVFSTSYGQEVLAEDDDADYYDVAVSYGYENEVIDLDAGIGYLWRNDDETTEKLMASASLLHLPTGLNLTLSAGDQRGDDAKFAYAKLGWTGDLISQGKTAVSVDYYDGSDFVVAGSDSTSWGLQAVQSFDDLSLQAYLGYRVYSFEDDSDADYEDISSLLMGVTWKF